MPDKRNAPAILVADLLNDNRPGAFKYYTQAAMGGPIAGLNFWCPCGCGRLSSVPWEIWTWDGNREKPTLTPSIDNKDCGWHGYLTAGEFKEI